VFSSINISINSELWRAYYESAATIQSNIQLCLFKSII